jgi:hypothetical protein
MGRLLYSYCVLQYTLLATQAAKSFPKPAHWQFNGLSALPLGGSATTTAFDLTDTTVCASGAIAISTIVQPGSVTVSVRLRESQDARPNRDNHGQETSCMLSGCQDIAGVLQLPSSRSVAYTTYAQLRPILHQSTLSIVGHRFARNLSQPD